MTRETQRLLAAHMDERDRRHAAYLTRKRELQEQDNSTEMAIADR